MIVTKVVSDDELDITGIQKKIADMGITDGVNGVGFARELTQEEMDWFGQTALELIQINQEQVDNDPTLDLDPDAALMMSKVLSMMAVKPSLINFLGFLARRNLEVVGKHEELQYFYALSIELHAKWGDIASYADDVAQRGGFDDTYHPDALELLNQILGESKRALGLGLEKAHVELLEIAAIIIEQASILVEARCINASPNVMMTEILPDLHEFTNNLLKNLHEKKYPGKPETIFRLLHARANLLLVLAYSMWPRIDKPGMTEDQIASYVGFREKFPEREERAKVTVKAAYNDLIMAANTAQVDMALKTPSWKAKAELELARLWIEFPDLSIEEFAMLENMDEHLSRARDLFSKINFDEGVVWCDCLWADCRGDLEAVVKFKKELTPLHWFILQ